jgi:hypothetical protein
MEYLSVMASLLNMLRRKLFLSIGVNCVSGMAVEKVLTVSL